MQSFLRSASKTMRYWQASQSCGGLPGGLAGSGLRALLRMRRTRGTSSSPKRDISGLPSDRDAVWAGVAELRGFAGRLGGLGTEVLIENAPHAGHVQFAEAVHIRLAFRSGCGMGRRRRAAGVCRAAWRARD